MSNHNSKKPADEMVPALRRALIECGAIIPTTPEEVLLAERRLSVEMRPAAVNAAFDQLISALEEPSSSPCFMRLDDALASQKDSGLAMAARNGGELDDETRAKIEASVLKIINKPHQDS